MNKIIRGSQVKELLNSISEYKIESGDLEHESVLTGKRSFIHLAEHREYNVTIYLFKFQNPMAELQELEQYENTIVKFRPNGQILAGAGTGQEADFYFEKIEPCFLDTTERYGACHVILKSIDGIVEGLITIQGQYGKHYGRNYGRGL